MSIQNAYKQKREAQLKEWSAQINLMEAAPRDPDREPVDITPGGPPTTRGSVSDLGKSIMDEFLNESTGCSVR